MLITHSKFNGYRLKILSDEMPMNPREEGDNLGTIVHHHGRYILGEELAENTSNYSDWDHWFEGEISSIHNGELFWLPVYIYDHSGITISTKPFHCPWDSGQVGFIYVTKEKVKEWYCVKEISAELQNKVYGYLKQEIETFDQYLTGNVWGFILEQVVDCECKGNMTSCCELYTYEQVDSCWGFYGDYDILAHELNVDQKVAKQLIENLA